MGPGEEEFIWWLVFPAIRVVWSEEALCRFMPCVVDVFVQWRGAVGRGRREGISVREIEEGMPSLGWDIGLVVANCKNYFYKQVNNKGGFMVSVLHKFNFSQ